MNIYLKIFFLFTFSRCLFSQNLIPDSSFENNKVIPTDFSGIGSSNTWSRPSMGTTDLFCKSDRKKNKYSFVDVPQNAMGFQYAHTGKCYAGFFLFSHGNYREYLQTPLATPLQKNKTYFFSLYISLANFSRASIDQIGFSFVSEELHSQTGDILTDLNPAYVKIEDVGSDTANWHHITARYKAKGGELYLIIGSFHVNKLKRTRFSFPKNTKSIINKNSERDAYYFVDDVSLTEMTNVPEQPDSVIQIGKDTLENIHTGTTLILKNVLFEKNKSNVLESSYPDLDRLAEYLLLNNEYKIEINGHTDNQGSESLNKRLSEERARQVAKYLVKKGVNKPRIVSFGYGAEKPLFPNDTEEHKSMNRRVEIVFIK